MCLVFCSSSCLALVKGVCELNDECVFPSSLRLCSVWALVHHIVLTGGDSVLWFDAIILPQVDAVKHGGLCWLRTCIHSLISYIYQAQFTVITNLYLLFSVYSVIDKNFILTFLMFCFI